jgi:hypothetical protein
MTGGLEPSSPGSNPGIPIMNKEITMEDIRESMDLSNINFLNRRVQI